VIVVCFTSSRNSTPVRCQNLINRSWGPLLDRAGLPSIPFHTLRHTAATLLLSRRVHPKVVQNLLGHFSIEITMDTYSHFIPQFDEWTVEAMEDVLGDD
jgi:integrase